MNANVAEPIPSPCGIGRAALLQKFAEDQQRKTKKYRQQNIKMVEKQQRDIKKAEPQKKRKSYDTDDTISCYSEDEPRKKRKTEAAKGNTAKGNTAKGNTAKGNTAKGNNNKKNKNTESKTGKKAAAGGIGNKPAEPTRKQPERTAKTKAAALKPFKCPVCSKAYKSKDRVAKHHAKRHPGTDQPTASSPPPPPPSAPSPVVAYYQQDEEMVQTVQTDNNNNNNTVGPGLYHQAEETVIRTDDDDEMSDVFRGGEVPPYMLTLKRLRREGAGAVPDWGYENTFCPFN
ncbi:hypothetical protein F5X99DRAFT_408418 [Biscogniauxia marginata]|nr:hypothetical protein F5X99DRAFT_408418 [Biscogniauxia marginata]